MRVHMPPDHESNPVPHLSEHYAKAIVAAGVQFSKAIYQHSKLSLREFEGARARTAEINGCTVCRTFRAGRDLPAHFSTPLVETPVPRYSHAGPPRTRPSTSMCPTGAMRRNSPSASG